MDTVCLSLSVSVSLSLCVCVWVCLWVCLSVCLVCLCACAVYVHMPMDARRDGQILKLGLQVTVSHKTQVLGTELGSSLRALY